MASRRKARILAFQALYAWEVSHVPLAELLGFSWAEEKLDQMEEELLSFSKFIIVGAVENLAAIDAAIKKHLSHWPFERIKKVDLAILRMGAYCLMFQHDIPAGITIDEAIEISKEFGSDDSYKFINGVLDGIRKDLSHD
ncbi:MAG: transcription antitermination factor NusB [Spirochaetota bacterium]